MWPFNKVKSSIAIFGKGHRVTDNISLHGKNVPSVSSLDIGKKSAEAKNAKSEKKAYQFSDKQIDAVIDEARIAHRDYLGTLPNAYSKPVRIHPSQPNPETVIQTDRLFAVMRKGYQIIFNGDRSDWSDKDYTALMYWGIKDEIGSTLWHERIDPYTAEVLLKYLRDGLETAFRNKWVMKYDNTESFLGGSRFAPYLALINKGIEPRYSISPYVGFLSHPESYYKYTLGVAGISPKSLRENISWILLQIKKGDQGEKFIKMDQLRKYLETAVSNPNTPKDVLLNVALSESDPVLRGIIAQHPNTDEETKTLVALQTVTGWHPLN
jgi:hypothetical protein